MVGRERILVELGNSTLKLAHIGPAGTITIQRYDADMFPGDFDPSPEATVIVALTSANQVPGRLWRLPNLRLIKRDDVAGFIGDSYQTPETLGLDRVLNLLGMDGDGIVVSCGTAITVDAVAGGEPCWGGIMPGFRTAAEGLHARVSRLPLVSTDDTIRIPARTSRESVANGVLLGTAGGAGAIVSALARLLFGGPPPRLVLTGGDAGLMFRLWEPTDAEVDPALLFRGMLRAAGES